MSASTILLCTDGLHRVVAPEAIAAILGRAGSPRERCDALIERALADGGPWTDNVAVAIIDIL